MKRASISEVKDQMSAYLRIVRSGESVLVTERGTPVARIVPVVPHAQTVGASTVLEDQARPARLERAGVIVRSGAGSPREALGEPLRAGTGVLNALLEEGFEEFREVYRSTRGMRQLS